MKLKVVVVSLCCTRSHWTNEETNCISHHGLNTICFYPKLCQNDPHNLEYASHCWTKNIINRMICIFCAIKIRSGNVNRDLNGPANFPAERQHVNRPTIVFKSLIRGDFFGHSWFTNFKIVEPQKLKKNFFRLVSFSFEHCNLFKMWFQWCYLGNPATKWRGGHGRHTYAPVYLLLAWIIKMKPLLG